MINVKYELILIVKGFYDQVPMDFGLEHKIINDTIIIVFLCSVLLDCRR